MDAILQGNIAGLTKCEHHSHTGIYLGYSPFNAGSVDLVLNPETGLVSPQFCVVFDDEVSTVPFMSKGKIPPNWTYLVQRSS